MPLFSLLPSRQTVTPVNPRKRAFSGVNQRS
jgi:hypothetical protein